ncbi:hypothetical protein A45J_0001 [hot springs metagenome]|uniref:Uncharacterized protein n=1 Tax=hot springs metagenome TaxID=433727 RepID=A0A5J4L497_9ZZZZ
MGRDRKWWIAYITVILAFVFLFAYHSIANDKNEALNRAIYHAKELQAAIEQSNIKEREVILRKVNFIRGEDQRGNCRQSYES